MISDVIVIKARKDAEKVEFTIIPDLHSTSFFCFGISDAPKSGIIILPDDNFGDFWEMPAPNLLEN